MKQRLVNIVTLNVHEFRDMQNRSNSDRLAQLLVKKLSQVDFLFLQEVYSYQFEHIEKLQKACGLPYKVFGYALSNFGNVFLSRFNIANTNVCKASVEYHETRSMTHVTIVDSSLGVPFHIFGVHLDHAYEHVRLEQMNHFFKYFQPLKSLSNEPHIVIGDFNSLCEFDYSQEYMQEQIANVRARGNWEKPLFNVYKRMTVDKGYVDAWKVHHSCDLDSLVNTCAYGTRNDYIYRKHVTNIVSCNIIDMEGATDHNAVHAQILL